MSKIDDIIKAITNDGFSNSSKKFKGESKDLQLYMITCKCQTRENYDPEKKCMCTCST